VSRCLFVCLYPMNVKTAEPIGPEFCVGPHVILGRFMNEQNFKNQWLKVFYFYKILKMREKIWWNPQTFFYILWKEKMLTDKATIKIWNRRWARSALKAYYIYAKSPKSLLYINIYTAKRKFEIKNILFEKNNRTLGISHNYLYPYHSARNFE